MASCIGLSLKFLVYNISGLKNKRGNREFFDFVNTFAAFVLIGTHVEENDIMLFENYFENFTLSWSSATRPNIFGRAKGGALVSVRKSQKGVSIVQINSSSVIRFMSRGEAIHVLPCYLNCNNWEHDFCNLQDFLSGSSDLNPIVAGDFNVRIAGEQDFSDTPAINLHHFSHPRRSRDMVLNSRGRRFLEVLGVYGLVVLNGRAPGDADGAHIFISGGGASVCDLVCASLSTLAAIRDLRVLSRHFSDHMPMSLEAITEDETGPPHPRLPRLR